ncbi:MAG: endonuclease/exonuclease/phosphatase family protein, partial [Bacteroidales bacterium]|nr:endonuclease/exonuclease/phosphatase family protein [Bacteroidales bacterium]
MKHLLHRGLLLGLLLVCTCQTSLYSQDYLRLLFYNTENYFDTKNDTLKQDDAFLPEGDYHWTP